MKKIVFLLTSIFVITLLLVAPAYATDNSSAPIVIPLGVNCYVSMALEGFGLKKASYPFEWNGTESTSLYASIDNDFSDFTNPDYFTFSTGHQRLVNKYGVLFAHNFELTITDENGNTKKVFDQNWRDQLPDMQKRYTRRIKRFRDACASNNKVYFIRHWQTTKELAIDLVNLLTSRYPTLNFTLICVTYDSPTLGAWNIPKIQNYYLPANPGGVTSVDVDNWKMIFETVGLIAPSKAFDNNKLIAAYNNHRKSCTACTDLDYTQ